MKHFKAKICMFGEPAVGKTSLIRRYVYDMFDDRYLVTIGTKVTKKTVELKINNEDVKVELLLWDIVGHQSFRNLLKDAYFFGAQGLIGVADITKKDTLFALEDWINSIKTVVDVSSIPIVFVANKIDLENKEFREDELKEFSQKYGVEKYLFTSAKTGENVNEAFEYLARKIVETSL